MVLDGCRWNSGDTTTNQKWVVAEEKRMMKWNKHEGVADGCQCAISACGGREMMMQGIVNNCTLLGHDAECQDPNTTMMASKIAGERNLI
jgi:hypothetical protein